MSKRPLVKAIAAALPLAIAAALPLAAQASPSCTKEPRSAWLSEAQMKQKLKQLGYHDIKVFKPLRRRYSPPLFRCVATRASPPCLRPCRISSRSRRTPRM